MKATDGRISAKRLLPLCRAAGYTGSARSLRRAVAEAKAEHRRSRRTYRPWQPVPGEHLVFDWGEQDGIHVFCAVLAWRRWRFVRFARRQDRATTLALLAACSELLGGVPCTVVEHLVGYAKSDLLVGLGPWATIDDANRAAATWCAEVNARVYRETSAAPEERRPADQAQGLRSRTGRYPDGAILTRGGPGWVSALIVQRVVPLGTHLAMAGSVLGLPTWRGTSGCRRGRARWGQPSPSSG